MIVGVSIPTNECILISDSSFDKSRKLFEFDYKDIIEYNDHFDLFVSKFKVYVILKTNVDNQTIFVCGQLRLTKI